MTNVIKKTRTKIIENFRATVSGEELRELLNQGKFENSPHFIPKIAHIYVSVPGGGDWSNCDLDLEDHPVIIEWTTSQELTNDSE